MASADMEKSSYSGFERFLFFMTPIVFTAILLGVLLLMFNPDWRNAALEFGNKIPVVKSLLPNPASQAGTDPLTDETLTVNNARSKLEELNALLADRETALQQATAQAEEQQKRIEELQLQVDQLSKESEEKTITGDAYRARIASLANMYGKMTPSKAAPILENLTLEESALVLGAMPETERGRVLERMTPKKAADVTMKLKDAEMVEDREIAALQARIKELENSAAEASSTLDTAELNQTLSGMRPQKAAELLLQMNKTNQAKVLRALAVLDNAARSQILNEMSTQDNDATANLVNKLMPANP
ncbi:magnesium transporter MgtE N-terminal domain-containing protein [Paenibacillaceae bacterium WGS1546]|uniref:magnesium transporter MgtE N-terminal domain-containing protein n=1 Tax=Cohnella sp. WGS1546 TaxID=3366810 RepID=UPI00372CF03E